MSVLLSELLVELNEKVRSPVSGSLDNTKRVRGLNRTLEDLQDYADWDFTKRTKTFYFIDGVYEYSLQNYIGCTCQDNDGSSSILDFKNAYDLRPISYPDQSLTGNRDVKEVRENIRRNRFIGEYAPDNGLLVVNYPRQVSGVLHNCDSLTADGTWAASGNASNLTLDQQTFKEGNGALNFDVSAGTSLILTNSTFTAKNYEALQNKSHIIMWVYLPTITNFTSIRLRWGSSSTAYWEKTETVPAGQTTLKAGWNLFAFRWASATETSSPDVTAIDYLQIVLTYSGSTTATDFRIDDIRIGKEVEMELDYYSLAMVKDAAGDYQLEFDPDDVTQTDELLGGVTARNAVSKGAIYECFQMIGGKSQRDQTDSLELYEQKKKELFAKCGHRLRKPTRVLNFAR